jgi:hypothetical protein
LKNPHRTMTRIIFLHIPKTAGQGIHSFFETLFRPEEICPARENFQLLPIPLAQLQQYRVFSGHLDWSLLDSMPQPKFVFTVLRRPIERLLSFYFFLRAKGSKLPPNALGLPEHRGMNAALNLPPDEYFSGSAPGLRQFIDDRYDNFYAYYFCGRSFDARHKLRAIMTRQDSSLTESKILETAIQNLHTLDRVYTTDELDRLEADVRARCGISSRGEKLSESQVNKGEGDFNSRLASLRELGATERTYKRLEEMTALDNKIWEVFCQNKQAVS